MVRKDEEGMSTEKIAEQVRHTPGPWHLDPKHEDCILDAQDHHVVCAGHDYNEEGIIENGADARLIAASPDLQLALADLLSEVLSAGFGTATDFNWPTAIANARNALSKAEGERGDGGR